MRCQARVLRGPRAYQPCRFTATMVVVDSGTFVCGVHARTWHSSGLARIAYWDPKARAWL